MGYCIVFRVDSAMIGLALQRRTGDIKRGQTQKTQNHLNEATFIKTSELPDLGIFP